MPLDQKIWIFFPEIIRIKNSSLGTMGKKYFRQIKKIKVTIFPEPPMGADGGFYELETGGYSGEAIYRYWCNPPAEWRPIKRVVNAIFDQFYKAQTITERLRQEEKRLMQ